MTVSNKKALATLDTTQINLLMSFSLMIVYQVLSSPTYVNLCKCLILCEIKKDRKIANLSVYELFVLCRIKQDADSFCKCTLRNVLRRQ